MLSFIQSSNANLDDIHELNSSTDVVEDLGLSQYNSNRFFRFFTENLPCKGTCGSKVASFGVFKSD